MSVSELYFEFEEAPTNLIQLDIDDEVSLQGN